MARGAKQGRAPGHRDHRRCADFCRSRQCGRVGRSWLVPNRSNERSAGLRGRRAARLLFRGRAALGQSPLRVGGTREGQLRLVDSEAENQFRGLRCPPHRSFPRLRHVLVHPGDRQDRQDGFVAAGARTRFFQSREKGAAGRALDRRRSGRADALGDRAARSHGTSGNGDFAIRVWMRRGDARARTWA